MRYSRALFAAALALSAAACGQSVSAPDSASGGIVPAGASYSGGVGWGGGQYVDTTTVSSNSTAVDTSTIAGPGSGDSRGVFVGGGH